MKKFRCSCIKEFTAIQIERNGWIKIGKDQEAYGRVGDWKVKQDGNKYWTLMQDSYFKDNFKILT